MWHDLEVELEARAAALRRRAASVGVHLRGEDGRNEADFGDKPSFTQGDEVLEQLDAAGLEELQQIDAALERLRNGAFGVCASCGEEIPEARLRAVPWAARCVRCATEA